MTAELVLHPRTRTLFEKIQGAVPQALIIEGPSGVGVRVAASYLARSMKSPALVIEPKKSAAGKLVVDYQEGNIVIDDIRQLYEQTRTKQSEPHVYILDTGERSMTIAAQNAFLKLLEEPRPGLHFIIATHHFDQLLPTIASRSQRLTLLPVTNEQSTAIIDNLAVIDDIKRARLAFVGRGLPALITRLAVDEKTYDARVSIMSDAKTMISGTAYEKAALAHKYKDNRAGSLTLLDDMNHQLGVILQKNPNQSLVGTIATNLDVRQSILTGGNIRLQLLAGML